MLVTGALGAAGFFVLRYMGIRPNEAKAEVLGIVNSMKGVAVVSDPLCEDGNPKSDFDGIDPWYVAAFAVGPADADIGRSVSTAAERHGYPLSHDQARVDMLKTHADPTTLEYIDRPMIFNPTTRYLFATNPDGYRLRVEIILSGAVSAPCMTMEQPPAGKAIMLVNLKMWPV